MKSRWNLDEFELTLEDASYKNNLDALDSLDEFRCNLDEI